MYDNGVMSKTWIYHFPTYGDNPAAVRGRRLTAAAGLGGLIAWPNNDVNKALNGELFIAFREPDASGVAPWYADWVGLPVGGSDESSVIQWPSTASFLGAARFKMTAPRSAEPSVVHGAVDVPAGTIVDNTYLRVPGGLINIGPYLRATGKRF